MEEEKKLICHAQPSLIQRVLEPVRSWGLLEYLVVCIIAVAAFLRLWNIPNSVMFQGDQGRDAIIVADIFRQRDLVFIGPVTSVGNMYLGPFYYYFMLPFLIASYPSPVGPVYAVAIVSVITTILLYFMSKEMMGRTVAWLSTLFFALSCVVVIYSRFSWNPNLAPLFGLLMVWGSYKAITKSSRYWILVAASFSVLLQLHYVTLLALPAAGLIWLYQVYTTFKSEKSTPFKKKRLIINTILAVVLSLFSLTPLLLFDYKHQWLNAQAFLAMFANPENIGGELSGLTRIVAILKETHGRSMHILFDLFIGQDRVRNTVLVILSILGLAGIFKSSAGKRQKAIGILAVYLIFAIIGTAFYQHTLFDHYLSYLFAVVPLFYGALLGFLLKHRVGLVLVVSFLGLFVWFNITRYPLGNAGWTIHDVKRTSDVIAAQVTAEEKYNIILLSESKDLYGQNYRYYLTTTATPPVRPENFAEADRLFIINENQPGVDVTQLPIYEIQTFPTKGVSAVYTVENGPEILVLERALDEQ